MCLRRGEVVLGMVAIKVDSGVYDYRSGVESADDDEDREESVREWKREASDG